VRNPEPGGGSSNELPLLIVTPNGLPRLTSLEPETKVPGDTAFTLVVNGTNFGINAFVRWQGSQRPTHFVNSTRLTAEISAADIASEGVFTVSVVNPPPVEEIPTAFRSGLKVRRIPYRWYRFRLHRSPQTGLHADGNQLY
jgi:hypothetical protein